MKKPSKHWEDNLGDRLKNLQGDPSIRAWERLEAELDHTPKKERSGWLIAAAITLLMASAALWLWQSGGNDVQPNLGIAQQEQTNNPSTGDTKGTSDQEPPAIVLPESKLGKTDVVLTPGIDASNRNINSNSDSGSATSSTDQQRAARQAPQSSNLLAQQAQQQSRSKATDLTQPTTQLGSGTSGPSAASQGSLSTLNGRSKLNRSSIAKKTSNSAIAYFSPPYDATKIAFIPSTDNQPLTGLVAAASLAPDLSVPAYSIKVPKILSNRTSFADMNATLALVEDKPKKRSSNAPALWIEAQPTMSYYMIEPSKDDNIMIRSVVSEPAISGSRLGGQLAAGFSLPVLNKLFWKSGGYYAYQQQRLSYTYQNAEQVSFEAARVDNNSLTIHNGGSNEQSHTIDLPLHNVGVSTGFSYKLAGKDMSSFLDTELLAQYNVHQKISSYISIGYAIQTRFLSNTSLKVGPSVQYQLSSTESLSPHFSEKPISFGLQLGVFFNE